MKRQKQLQNSKQDSKAKGAHQAQNNRMQSLLGFRIWSIAYPLLLYWATVVIVMFLAQMTLGVDKEHYMQCQIIATLIAIPVMYVVFYRPDHSYMISVNGQKAALDGTGNVPPYDAAMILVISLLCGAGLNNLLIMSPLARLSAGFAQANEGFYGGAFVWQVLGAGVLTPILEEMVYRGIVFERLRRMMNVTGAMILSSLLFAIMHFNVVQFVYAFLIGLLLAYFVERTDNVKAAIMGHMLINLLSVTRTQTGWLEMSADGSLSAWLISCGLLLMGLGVLSTYIRKATNGKTSDQKEKTQSRR